MKDVSFGKGSRSRSISLSDNTPWFRMFPTPASQRLDDEALDRALRRLEERVARIHWEEADE